MKAATRQHSVFVLPKSLIMQVGMSSKCAILILRSGSGKDAIWSDMPN